MHFSTSTLISSLLLLATSAQAFNLYFYLGTECNGEETAVITDFSTADVCSTMDLTTGNAESLIIEKQDTDADGAEIAFYGSTNCDTSGQVIVLDDNGCVDYSGLDAMSYVVETP
ncbi:hypothetical protein LTR85_011542 [Meristemomyces frigidus]|nr:hypothetical protein LTR85_011542 [Meristemomyces frigidus]